jgi:hypothetical protein
MHPIVLAVALAGAAPPASTGPAEPVDVAAARLLSRAIAAEPAIDEVQRAAAACAAPPAGTWDSRARLAALVPRVSTELRVDDRRARVVGLTGSSAVDYLRDTPGAAVELKLSWELPGLVYSDAELRAAALLQAQARARREAVERATKLYYERQRLRLSLAAAPPPTPRDRAADELRLLELAAELDGLTNGAFTRGER